LVCGHGFQAQGDTCVALPERAKEAAPPKEAARPKEATPPKQEAVRPRPSRRTVDDSGPPPARSRTGRADPNFAPEGGQQRGTRANNAISETPFTQGGMKCHTLDIQGLAPRIVCP
jgi:hypothetical protein